MGIVDFREQMLPQYVRREEEEALTEGPDAPLVACSDSLVVPGPLASTEPGDLCTRRDVDNLMPPATPLTQDVYAFVFSQWGLMAGIGIEGSKITRIR